MLAAAELIEPSGQDFETSLAWKTSPALRELLDVVARVAVNEYTRIARENPTLFGANGVLR